MYFRKYFLGVLCIYLFIWKPIYFDWEFFFLIELACLFLLYRILFYLSGFIWQRYNISPKMDSLFSRFLSGFFAVFFLSEAYLFATSKTHLGNSMRVVTRDGYENLGDDIVLPGPDYVLSFICILFSIALFNHTFSSYKK